MSDPAIPVTEEQLEHLYNLLLHVNSSSDDIRQPAEAELAHIRATDVIGLILACAIIIRMESPAQLAIAQALIQLRLCFTPTHQAPRDLIIQHWQQVDARLRHLVVEAIMRSLLFPDQVVVGLAALVFALLLACEGPELLSFLPQLFALVADSDAATPCRLGALMTLREIAAPDILCAHLDAAIVKKSLADIFTQVLQWMADAPNLPDNFLIEMLQVLAAISAVAPADVLLGTQVLEYVLPLLRFPRSDPQVDRRAWELLVAFTRRVYVHPQADYSGIGDTSVSIINGDDGQHAIAAMEFWIDIAKFEHRLEKRHDAWARFCEAAARAPMKNRTAIKQPPEPVVSRKLCGLVSEHVAPRLIQFMLKIDPDSRDAEDPNDKLPHMVATVLLQALFKIAPRVIFTAVTDFWKETVSVPSIWSLSVVQHHALFLSLSTVLAEPQDQAIYDFLMVDLPTDEQMPLLLFLASGLSAPIPILNDTALYTISLCIQNYGLLTSEDPMREILTCMHKLLTPEQPPVIVTRIFMVLKAMVNWAKSSASHDTFLVHWFDSIYQFPIDALKRPDAMDCPIFNEAYFLIQLLVQKAPASLVERIAIILTECEEVLRESIGTDSIPIIVLQQQLRCVTSCFFKFGDALKHHGVKIAEILFAMMRNHNAVIWEDALIALILVITQLKNENAMIYSSERLRDLLDTALSSESPGLIANTVYALSKFYGALVNDASGTPQSEDLLRNLPHAFDLIMSCLNGTNFTPSSYPTLLTSLADIIHACHEHIAPSDRENLFNVYWKFMMELRFDNASESDVEYANQLFAAIFKGFAAILHTYGSDDSVRDDHTVMRLFMIEPPKKFLGLAAYSDPAMVQFCLFLKKYADVYGRKGNILLNRIANYTILCHGKAMANPRVQATAEETMKLLRKA
jgi:hypothetical protein